ncbi:hypothetical protein DFH06DRAFT_565034 [Mycena polygramma]|nr:hypothetical protein DFH06DRAFT_565034 [Mycena polygramma]
MLEDLRQWCSQTDFGSSVLWLHGPAGAGKSAIAQSFCQRLEAEGRLGASFFFKRGDIFRGSGNKLFSTIAYQLARSRPDLKQAISVIVEDDPSIVDKDLSTQVLKLIIEPCARGVRNHNLVIVIDGLDECEGQRIQQQILLSLGMAVCEQHSPLRILVASRPELHIQEVLQGLTDNYRPLNINQSFEDVQKYLVDEFVRIHREHWRSMAAIPGPWPSSNIIEKLTDNSSGFFVYASIIVRFIDDHTFRPTERLDVIMGIHTAKSGAPFAALDQLYIQILSAVPAERRPRLLEVLAVVAAKFNLSSIHIEQLLELQPDDAGLILRHLHSVLDVPRHAHARITAHHASFLDFLGDPTRSGVFHIDELQRANLARRILNTLSSEIAPSTDHVAWQLDQVEFEYITSVQPSAELVSLLHTFNTDFLVFPNVHHVVRQVLGWLKRCPLLPHDLIQLWEGYRIMVSDGVRSRNKLKSQGVPWRDIELYRYRFSWQASAQLIRITFHKVRQLTDPLNLSTVEAAAEARHIDHDLQNMDPSIAEELASSLHNLGVGFATVGRQQEALYINKAAVQLRRKLGETDPSVINDLANSLHNLGASLSAAGRHQDALQFKREAVGIFRRLVKTDPSLTESLANSLNNLGANLRITREHKGAVCAHKEAVELYRKLAETDPTVTKNLASSLHNLGLDLRGAGEYEAGVRTYEEVVELRRRLAVTDPTVTKDLASSLYNLGVDLHNTGRYEAAVRAEEEAIKLFRKLAETELVATSNLASSMNELGSRAEEGAVKSRRRRVETDLTVTKDLAASLYSLGYSLCVVGRHQDALSASAEAAEIRRKLVQTDPAIQGPLDFSLENLALNLNAIGRHEDAARTAQEAIEYSSNLSQTVTTELHRGNVLTPWATHLRTLDHQPEDSVRIHEKGAEIHRRRSEKDTESTVDSLTVLAEDLSITDLPNDALSAAEKAIKLFRRLLSTEPALTLTKDFIEYLQYQVKSLRALGREEDAVHVESKLATLKGAHSQLKEVTAKFQKCAAMP